MDAPLSEKELAELESLAAAATPGPWVAHVEAEAPIGGESTIGLYVPRLLAEVRRLRDHS